MNIKPVIVPLIIVFVLAAGIWYLTRPQAKSYGGGATEHATLVSIADIGAAHVGKQVAIEGVIAKECPHSGCWAVIQDPSGQIRIDTKPGGFALPLHREGAKVRVVGTVVQKQNGDFEIAAQSADL